MSDNVAKANALKDKGNAAFAKGDNQSAIDLFSQAIALDASNHIFYSNRAAAYTAHATKHNKQDYFDLAIQDSDKAIELKADFVKAYIRKAAALIGKKQYADAVKAYAAGIVFEPSNNLLTDGLAQAQKLLAKSQTLTTDEVIIGIDLGTTYSCVGVWMNDKVQMIPNDRGNITTPSFVCFTDTGKRHVGQAAKNLASQFPKTTLYDVKRLIGKTYDEEGVQDDLSHFSFNVVPSEGSVGKTGRGKPLVEVDFGMHGVKRFAPEEVSAMVLGYLKKCAEQYLKREVTKAVITVPAYFSDSQRVATKAAGRIAGLDVVRIINEPTAAALSYGLDRKGSQKPTNVLIFDLGGGTFDVSVLRIDGGIVEVKATGGDTRLGGEDFDIAATQFLIQEGISKGMPDISGDWKALRRLQTAAEQAKRILSNAEETEIHIEGLYTLDEKARGSSEKKKADFKYTLTKAKFEEINKRFFVKCLDTVERVLKDAKLKAADIHDIVLVGGSTRIPKLQAMLSQHFGGVQLCKSLNPDEAVAYGAAVQGAILTGARSSATDNMLLRDVTPLSLGIETVGRVMSVIIPRNTAIPCLKTEIYTTEANYQTEVDICVYEGERLRTDENNLLGKFTISGIERAKKGEPKIEVSFSLDSNGMLNVTARDLKTNAEANITIDSASRSSDDDIERMLHEAEQFKKDDEERIKQMDALNELETLVGDVQNLALEVGDAKKAEQLNNAVTETQSWMEEHGENAKSAEIKMKKRHLDFLITKLSKH